MTWTGFIAGIAASAFATGAAWGSPARDFAGLLEGRYDNDMQIFFEKEQVKSGAPQRVGGHISIRKVKDGEFTVQIASDAHADHPLEQTWTLTARDGGVETAIMGDLDGTARACVARWLRDGEAYKASPSSTCPRGISGPGAQLSQTGLESGPRADGLAPDQFKRIRPFECWVAVLRGAKHGDSGMGAPDTAWFFKRGVWVHDQGGLATIETDEAAARQIRLRLRRVAWPSGPNRPSLTLYVLEPGNERAVSYAWGEFDAQRLGINLRWMQASCTYAPDKMWP